MQGKAPKIFIGVLVLLAIVYIVLVVLGSRNKSNGQADLSPNWVGNIQNVFAKPKPLELNALKLKPAQIGCLSPQSSSIAVPVGKSCIYQIGKSPDNVRRLRLQTGNNQIASLALTQKIRDEDFTSTQNLPAAANDPANPEYVDVFQDGGDLVITCNLAPGVSSCLLKT
jgi:hypothetical protein